MPPAFREAICKQLQCATDDLLAVMRCALEMSNDRSVMEATFTLLCTAQLIPLAARRAQLRARWIACESALDEDQRALLAGFLLPTASVWFRPCVRQDTMPMVCELIVSQRTTLATLQLFEEMLIALSKSR